MLSRRDLLASAAALPAAAQAPARKPNFVVFLADDLAYQDLGCTGSDYIKTPHIDALAKTGTRLSQWYSNAPVCAPSRSSLMTGRYPQNAGVPLNGRSLAPEQKTIATLLKQHGYRTGITGKWHLGSTSETVPNAHGFDFFYGFLSGCVDYYSHRYYWGEPRLVNYHDLWRDRTEVFEDGQYFTDLVAREAGRFIASSAGQPFFLYVPFSAPHYPMHAPRSYMQRFAGLPLEQNVRAAMLAALDDAVGTVVADLKKHGLYDSTLIFFSADNGATREPRAGLDGKPPVTGSNGPFRGYKFSLFDGGMHVPAIASWPGRIPAGKVNAEIGAHMDLLPTICAAAGVPVPHAIDGRDMLPVLTRGAKSPHDGIFWMQGKQQAMRRGPWKLVVNGFEASGTPEGRRPLTGEDAVFLSNVESDPGERRNLRGQNAQVATEMQQALAAWAASVPKAE